ncbi:MAG: F0F1 ATP synthase subunit gamma, partial [Eubacteriales bacterium]|nr:F0F1 ATP synthase subunit gamma [Eubacteriales bacterium]
MAGTSTKDIKLRIKSVESTMQITKAMQLVATSKLRRVKERMESSKPYTKISTEALQAAVAACEEPNVPFVTPREVKKRCYVVIAGDRGLAGGYNSNVFKAFAAHSERTPYCVLPLGRKAIEHFHRHGAESLLKGSYRVEGTSVGACYKLAQLLTEGYNAQQFDELWIVYTSFQNM